MSPSYISNLVSIKSCSAYCHVETDGSHSALGCSFNSFSHCSVVEVRALYYSPLMFSAQSELNDFFDFFRLAVADKNGHDPSIFAKAFDMI